jgi:hypothetical protein
MRAIIQFDARDNPRGFGATDDKINVLLGNAVRVTEFPIPVRASDDVGETDLARYTIAISDDRREGPQERGLVLGQQETTRHEGAVSRTPTPDASAPALFGTIVHEDHFQSSLETAITKNAVAKSG